MINPNQMHRMPAGLDQQGRFQTRTELLRAEELQTAWLNTSPDVHHIGAFAETELPDDTDGFGFAPGQVRPVPAWQQAIRHPVRALGIAALRLADRCADHFAWRCIRIADSIECSRRLAESRVEDGVIKFAESIERHVTPIRVALAVTYLAAGCAVAMVLAGSW